MKFKKDTIIPEEIITRNSDHVIVFGTDVEIIDNAIYPQNILKQNECLVKVLPSNNQHIIKFNDKYRFSMVPRGFNDLDCELYYKYHLNQE